MPMNMQMMMGPRCTDDQIRNQVHVILTDGIQELVEDVAHLEETWSPDEIRKRVVRYLYRRSMQEEMVGKTWKEAVKKFAEIAAQSYAAACGEKAWYEELALIPVVCKAAEAIAEGCHSGWPALKDGEASFIAKEIFELTLHKSKVDKVLWEAAEAAFGADEKSAQKFYNALSKTYMLSFEQSGQVRGKGKVNPLARTEKFISLWMGEAVNRAWGGVEDPETTFTEDTLTEFFSGILTNDGIAENFTCLPPSLAIECQDISSDGWAEVLRPLAVDILKLNNEPSAKSKKRKRKEEEDALAGLEIGEEAADVDAETY